MISVDRVYQTLLMIANSDIRGNVKPRDLRLGLYTTVNTMYEEYIPDIIRATNRENRGLINSGIENLPNRIREKVRYFLIEDAPLTYSAPFFDLPDNVRYIDNIYYNGATEVEICKTSKEFKLITKNADTTPTTDYPLGLTIGNQVKIAPDTINANVTISYLRNPLIPNWTFNIIGGAEVFDPSKNDFQDIDLHPSEESNIIIRTLSLFGVNLKENDLVNYSQGQAAQEFNQDNTM